jgi:hypothetical protein
MSIEQIHTPTHASSSTSSRPASSTTRPKVKAHASSGTNTAGQHSHTVTARLATHPAAQSRSIAASAMKDSKTAVASKLAANAAVPSAAPLRVRPAAAAAASAVHPHAAASDWPTLQPQQVIADLQMLATLPRQPAGGGLLADTPAPLLSGWSKRAAVLEGVGPMWQQQGDFITQMQSEIDMLLAKVRSDQQRGVRDVPPEQALHGALSVLPRQPAEPVAVHTAAAAAAASDASEMDLR